MRATSRASVEPDGRLTAAGDGGDAVNMFALARVFGDREPPRAVSTGAAERLQAYKLPDGTVRFRAVLNGSVVPGGEAADVHFEFGLTTALGRLRPSGAARGDLGGSQRDLPLGSRR